MGQMIPLAKLAAMGGLQGLESDYRCRISDQFGQLFQEALHAGHRNGRLLRDLYLLGLLVPSHGHELEAQGLSGCLLFYFLLPSHCRLLDVEVSG